MKLYLLFIITIFSTAFAQKTEISGSVIDAETGEALIFTNVRIAGTLNGTSTNKEGVFELKADPGNYKLIASFIGYIADTISVDASNDVEGIEFRLEPSAVQLPEVTVLPGVNPALEVIRRAIERKEVRNDYLHSYEFKAYTKGVVLTTEDVLGDETGITIETDSDDSSDLVIAGIIENQSMNFYEKPDEYKEKIIARKQTANLPSSVNILTGGRLVQNFYTDNLAFFNNDMVSPIGADALNYYYFRIEDTVSINNKNVFKLHMEPDDSDDPGFFGRIYILDKSFDLIKVELSLNRAANIGGIFDSLLIDQQFQPFGDKEIYMPVDYRLYMRGNVLGLLRFGAEMNSVLYDYEINKNFDEDFFDKAIITVLPDADKKDSAYWSTTQTIPTTLEEKKAYDRIDSVESQPESFWDDLTVGSLLSDRLRVNDNFSFSGPMDLYRFNRVEGHVIKFGLYLDDLYEDRDYSRLRMAYGFDDEKFKWNFYSRYRFGTYRTGSIRVRAFNDIYDPFEGSTSLSTTFRTMTNLYFKYDDFDYYYRKGFSAEVESWVLPIMEMKLGFTNRTDRSAQLNTEWTITNTEKTFRENPPIYDTRLNIFELGFRLDFRDYIEDGMYRRRTSMGKPYFIFSGNVRYSDPDLLNSSLRFTTYEANIYGRMSLFMNTRLNVDIFGKYTEGALPYQMLYALPGNVNLGGFRYTYRTLNLNEIAGDRILSVMIEQNWNNYLFRMFDIPLLQSPEVTFSTFFNAAYSEISDESSAVLVNPIETFGSMFYEAGFTIGHLLSPINLSFAWRLNHNEEETFRFGLTSFLMF